MHNVMLLIAGQEIRAVRGPTDICDGTRMPLRADMSPIEIAQPPRRGFPDMHKAISIGGGGDMVAIW